MCCDCECECECPFKIEFKTYLFIKKKENFASAPRMKLQSSAIRTEFATEIKILRAKKYNERLKR